MSLYIDEVLYEKVRSQAKEKGMSLSGYVGGILMERINGWSEGYFDLVGSLKDDEYPIELPKELLWELDAHREDY